MEIAIFIIIITCIPLLIYYKKAIIKDNEVLKDLIKDLETFKSQNNISQNSTSNQNNLQIHEVPQFDDLS